VDACHVAVACVLSQYKLQQQWALQQGGPKADLYTVLCFGFGFSYSSTVHLRPAGKLPLLLAVLLLC
jgi:hypothetical protein